MPNPAHGRLFGRFVFLWAHASIPRQLRDLIICPDERGVVNYVQDQSIMERNITDPSSVSLFCAPTNHPTPLPSFVHLARLLSALLQQTKEACEKRKTSAGNETFRWLFR